MAGVLGRVGRPEAETIVFNHERLYLPRRRPEIPDLGKQLPEVRRLIREQGHEAAREFSIQRAAEQGHFNYHSDPFHLAFELKLEMPANGPVTNYLRATDFQTGEVSVGWSDEDGTYLRRLFVSRPDNVAVLSLTRPDARRLNLTIAAPLITHELIRSARHVETDGITYQNAYEHSPGGYDSVVRVITEGGARAKRRRTDRDIGRRPGTPADRNRMARNARGGVRGSPQEDSGLAAGRLPHPLGFGSAPCMDNHRPVGSTCVRKG